MNDVANDATGGVTSCATCEVTNDVAGDATRSATYEATIAMNNVASDATRSATYEATIAMNNVASDAKGSATRCATNDVASDGTDRAFLSHRRWRVSTYKQRWLKKANSFRSIEGLPLFRFVKDTFTNVIDK